MLCLATLSPTVKREMDGWKPISDENKKRKLHEKLGMIKIKILVCNNNDILKLIRYKVKIRRY